MKGSLSKKIFTTIVLVFIFMILAIMLSMYIYFSQFYEGQRILSIATKLKYFEQNYKQNAWTEEQLFRETSLFSSQNNVRLTVDRQNGEHNEGKSNVTLITVQEENGSYLDFFILSDQYNKYDLKVGDDIEINGVRQTGDVIVVSDINGMSLNNEETSDGENHTSEGEVEKSDSPDNAFSGMVKVVDIMQNLTLPRFGEQAQYNIIETYDVQDVTCTISQIPHTDVKQVDFNKYIVNKNGEGAMLYANASLQSVQETLSYVQRFFPYFFVASLVLALVVATIFSRSVIRPITRITGTADAMANMDFKTKLDEGREDELGQLSKSLNTLSSNLEDALTDLTLANKKLKEDYEKELKQEKARKEFIANASHELKTPLGIIKGYAEGIKDGVENDTKDTYIDVITDEISKMDKLILEMIRISKYDSLVMDIKLANVDILEMMHRLIPGFEHSMARKKLLVDIDGDFKACFADEEKLEMAFLNLFGNAVKYSKPSTTIQISSTKKDSKHRIEIYNESEPLTKEQLERVWDRFYRGDTSHSSVIEGSGLGLAIVKSIFDAHDIEHGVYNRDNGVVFWFELACADIVA